MNIYGIVFPITYVKFVKHASGVIKGKINWFLGKYSEIVDDSVKYNFVLIFHQSSGESILSTFNPEWSIVWSYGTQNIIFWNWM